MLSVEDGLVGTLTKQQGRSCHCVGCGLTCLYSLRGLSVPTIPFWKAINSGVFLASVALGRHKPLNPTRYAVNLQEGERHTAEIRIKGPTSESRACPETGHCIAKAYSYLAFDRGLFVFVITGEDP
jgi:hypothetical protein